MGLDIWMYKKAGWREFVSAEEIPGEEQIEIDSALYPDHYFKIGYFRSSYNEAGFNRTMAQYGLPDMSDLFGNDKEYIFAPNWQESLSRIELALKGATEAGGTVAKYRVICMDGMDVIRSEEEALRAFMEEEKGNHAFKAYSNRKGTFFLDGLECVGFMRGEHFRAPCCWVIVKNDPENWKHYTRSLEIMAETVRYVLSQPNPDDFYFHWSG